MRRPAASTPSRWRAWLGASWWIVFPACLVLMLALVRHRACFDRQLQLPIAAHPLVAWLLAGIYVLGHAWLVAAYSFTVVETERLLPPLEHARKTWGPPWVRLWAMIALIALNSLPVAIWIGITRRISFICS